MGVQMPVAEQLAVKGGNNSTGGAVFLYRRLPFSNARRRGRRQPPDF
ncbi:hypothetical protein LMG31506_04608 [Cupriavidus yeoncheonensis]|uniref:Uncharacterized protein n=1 Tax=Cupriavidus yeoncheonensis TaxID=1462994 RepID=A0A916MZI0_9BURK|nr:hypothetical protein LMG31506_04608 [Cupriavidus yeoncheonensis]